MTEKQLLRRENRLRAKEEKRLAEEAKAQKAAQEQKKLDEKYMGQALKLAKKAAELDEVPIGCVIVHEGKVIARGYNRRNTDKSTLAHAEIAAIRKASRKLSDWRLEECTLYVTLEPCQMCAGAIVQARTSRVVIGAMNPKAGCAGSIVNLLEMKEFNHRVDVTRGVLEEQCSQILKDFFAGLRKRVKEENTNEDKM
ncbi:MAG: tRNA adenosine(34) deaminase TadA [Lachnospiraceae bacterium]|nr:tRNA adenosine(34) deaminase TadA [Lachnospiraceae bacterium]